MKHHVALVVALSFATPALLPAAEAASPAKEPAPAKTVVVPKAGAPAKEVTTATSGLKDFTQKLSYAIGFEFGQSMKQMKKNLELDSFIKGLRDSFEERNSLLSDEESNEVKKQFMMKMQSERAAQVDDNLKAADKFLTENKKKPGVIATASGLQYIVVQEGKGASPSLSDEVTVNYRGTLLDGTEFDSSYKRNEPATFRVQGVIPGWTEALQLMKVGGKYRVFIPPTLGYGPQGQPPVIPPNSMLIFEVELIKTEKAKPMPAGHPAIAPE